MISVDLGIATLSQYDASGFLGIQIDALGGADAGMPPFELRSTFGFASRPLDPANGKGCATFFGYRGNQGFAWLANDPRVVSKVPPLAKGGSAVYASDGGFATFNPDTHTWTLYQPYEFDENGDATKAHVLTVGIDANGKPIVELSSGEGPSVTIVGKEASMVNAAGNAWMKVGDSGTEIVGPLKAFGGADLGGTGSEPLAKSAALLTWATEVVTALAGLGVTLPPLAPTVATVTTKGA